MEDINNRLNKISDFYRFKSYSEFSKKTGINHQTISNYLKGKQKPDADKLSIIIESFEDINAEWLVTGKGSMLKESITGNPKDGLELDDKTLETVIEAILIHEEKLMKNPIFKQWYDNKMLVCENKLLKQIKANNAK